MKKKVLNLDDFSFMNSENFKFNYKEGWTKMLYHFYYEVNDLCHCIGFPFEFKIEEMLVENGELNVKYFLKYECSENNEQVFERLKEKIDKVIENYKIKSITVCENCGRKGSLVEVEDTKKVRCKNCI